MKCFIAWALMISLVGCTTLRPIDAVQPGLSQRIAAGELKIGDQVIIETTDWQTYEFKIASVSGASIERQFSAIATENDHGTPASTHTRRSFYVPAAPHRSSKCFSDDEGFGARLTHSHTGAH